MSLNSYRFVLPLLMMLASVNSWADAEAGKSKAVTCTGCHGPAGISVNPLWPNLAGQQQQYLVKQITDFRDGQRQDPLMAPLAQGLTDQDIADLAAYYNQLPAQ